MIEPFKFVIFWFVLEFEAIDDVNPFGFNLFKGESVDVLTI